MNSKIKILIGILAVLLIIFSILYLYLGKNEASETRDPIFYEYHSEMGFSFPYPEYMRVVPASLPGDNYRLAVVYNDKWRELNGDAFGMIIISAALNDENLTPEEWLLSPASGFNHSQKYLKIKVGGEDAVRTEDARWTVVNTPDGKWRLSITDSTPDGAQVPLDEMVILANSLKFDIE